MYLVRCVVCVLRSFRAPADRSPFCPPRGVTPSSWDAAVRRRLCGGDGDRGRKTRSSPLLPSTPNAIVSPTPPSVCPHNIRRPPIPCYPTREPPERAKFRSARSLMVPVPSNDLAVSCTRGRDDTTATRTVLYHISLISHFPAIATCASRSRVMWKNPARKMSVVYFTTQFGPGCACM